MKPLKHSSRPQFLFRPQAAPRINQPILGRRFVTPPTQTLTATRTLPYPTPAIYSIIADVPSYSSFLPYCTRSAVTRWSKPDSNGQKWPEEAQLVVGWKGIQETFTSKIYCVPGKIVEAVGGRSKTTLKKEEIGHHTHAPTDTSPDTNTTWSASSFPSSLNPFASSSSSSSGTSNETSDSILTHLMTRWTVRPFPYKPPPIQGSPPEGSPDLAPREHTQVTLSIEFQFANPVYSAMSAAVTDKVAGIMIQAFEGRVRQVLEESADGPKDSVEAGVASR